MRVKLFILKDGARELPYIFTDGVDDSTLVYDPFSCETYNLTNTDTREVECIYQFMAQEFSEVSRDRWVRNLEYKGQSNGVITYELSFNDEDGPDNQTQTVQPARASCQLEGTSNENSWSIEISETPISECVGATSPEEIPTMPRRSPRRRYLTLMPYSSFEETAESLSDKELKLMRVVALRVLRVLTSDQNANLNRARRRAVTLWRGHTQALVRYGIAIARELVSRGYKDTSMEEFRSHFVHELVSKPSWVFWSQMRSSHQAYINLLRLREAYAQHMVRLLESNPDSGGLREYLRSVGHKTVRTMSYSDMYTGDFDLPRVRFPFSEIPKEDFVFPNEN